MLAFTVSTKGTVLTCEIGSKSLTGSYGSLAKKDGLTVWPLAVSSTVYPSGACLATYSVAMLPPAPGRFSTMTGCPSTGCRPSAIRRASRSFEPPGGRDTMMRTGRAGQDRSEEHTSELQSLAYLVCRLL